MSKFFFKHSNKDNWKVIKSSFADYINEFKKNKKDFSIEVKKIGTKPSGRQRGYYYGVVLPSIKKAMENGGNIVEVNKLDDDLREKMGFVSVEENVLTGTMRIKVKSFSDFSGSKIEVTDYITKVIIWAEDFFKIEIPRPQLRGYDFLLTNRKKCV